MAVLTTSGTYTYSASAISLLTAALRICQAIGEDETPAGVELQNGLDAFNLLVKNIQVSGAHVWIQEEAILFLQPGQSRYQLGAGSPDNACLFADLTTTSITVNSTGTTATVASIAGINSGDTIGIQLDVGSIFWTTVDGAPSGATITLTAALPSQASLTNLVFDFAAPLSRPLKVRGARRFTYATQSETPLIPMTRRDYANLSTKQATGIVQNFFFDPQTGQGAYANLIAVMSFYPAALNDTMAVRFTAQRPIQDFATLANIPDFPAEWLAALKWMLAAEIGPEYGVPPTIMEIIKGQAGPKLEMLIAWDKEDTGTSTLPFVQPVYQLIARALRICNAIGPQDVPALGLVNNGIIALNALIQQWQASDIHVWCEEEAILFPQPAQPRYSISSASTDHATLFNTLIQTTLAVTAAAGAGTITLTSASGVQSGDNIGIQLDLGTNFWTTVNGAPAGNVVTLTNSVPSQASAPAIVFDYTTPLIRPLRVYGGRRYNYLSRIDTPMQMWARLDYQQQPNKNTTGVQTAFFYDPQTSPTPFGSSQLGSALLNLWPSPSNNQFGFRFTAQRPIALLTDLTSSADFPVEWQNAIAFNLALELWPEYGKEPETGVGYGAMARISAFQAVGMQAAEKLRMAQGWDREPESVMFGVAMYPGARRG
jgi:hypothetical protein